MTVLENRLKPGMVLRTARGVRITIARRRGTDQYGEPRWSVCVGDCTVPTHGAWSRDELAEMGVEHVE